MRRGPRTPLNAVLTTVVLTVLMLAGSAVAQSSDGLLNRYETVVANLRSAVDLVGSDPAQARDDIDRASNSLIPLAGATENAPLVAAMERIFERARTALENGSEVDLAVQSQVLEGGFQRLVFEAALVAARAGELELARERTAVIATDMELGATAQEAIAAAGSSRALRLALEAAIADRLGEQLARIDAQLDSDADAAYRTFGGAYGDFLLVQDSPRASDAINAGFTAAAAALVNGDAGTVREELAGLEQSFLALGREARAAAAVLPNAPAGAPQSAPEAAPAGDAASPAAPVDGAAPDGAAAAVETGDAVTAAAPRTAEPEATAAAPAESADDAAVATTEATAETTAGTTAGATAPATPDLAASDAAAPDARALAATAIARELAGSGLPPLRRQQLADAIAADGFGDFGEVVDALLASSAELTVAVETGDASAQRRALDDYRRTYRSYVAPALEERDPAYARSTERLVASLAGAPGLRIQDTAVLSGHTSQIPAVLNGRPTSATHRLIAGVVPLWSGWVRAVTMLVLGLLALVPLYLLNLAFGGGNRNWQLIGVALFLLTLPVIYEGLAYLGTLLGDITGVAALGALGTFSIFQNVLAQVVWALVTAVAIVLASVGLYGICVQFGLLGRAASPDATQTATIDQTDTLVDWDEEF